MSFDFIVCFVDLLQTKTQVHKKGKTKKTNSTQPYGHGVTCPDIKETTKCEAPSPCCYTDRDSNSNCADDCSTYNTCMSECCDAVATAASQRARAAGVYESEKTRCEGTGEGGFDPAARKAPWFEEYTIKDYSIPVECMFDISEKVSCLATPTAPTDCGGYGKYWDGQTCVHFDKNYF